MKKIARVTRTARPRVNRQIVVEERRSAVSEYAPMAFGGLLLVAAFAFAGHYMGQNAVAHNAGPDDLIATVSGPKSDILAKGSLLVADLSLQQHVVAEGKGDVAIPDPVAAVAQAPEPAPVPKPTLRIEPAAVNLEEAEDSGKTRVALAPTPRQVEKAIKLKRSAAAKPRLSDKEKQKAIAQRRVQMAEENCLARAIYFEARSESELGQVAVAKVVLNRVKDPEYPNTICGVVYQGSGRRNSCQFSFACDGLPDDVKSAAAWSKAKRLAKKVIAGDAKVAALTTATNYHADYVNPKWAKSMKRLIKIGRHVFYEDS